jgi:hypothetical protein
MRSFNQRVDDVLRGTQSDVLLLLRPLMSDMPAPMHFQDDPFFPFSKDIITATRDVVVGYIFDFPAYMVHAGAGARALERSMAFTGVDLLKVLHGSFVGAAYIPMIYKDALGADAATLADARDLPAYLEDETQGAFVVRAGKVDENVQSPTYWAEAGRLQLADSRKLRVAGTDVLYSDYTYDYASKCRAAIEAMRDA